MSFTTTENISFVATIFQSFMREKYGIDFNNIRLLTQTMQTVYQNYPQLRNNVDQMNKITISELKEKVLQQVQSQNQTPPPSQSATPLPAPLANSPGSAYPQEQPIQDTPSLPLEVEFVQKLQKLEQQRNAFTPPPPEKFDVKPAEQVYSHPQATASPVIPANIQTVYMPAPERIGTEIKVGSWQRDWLNYPKRNGFYYSRSLPLRLNITDVRLGCVIVPGEIAQGHPILSIYIEGPNNQDHQISIVLDKQCSYYGVYRPATPSLSYMYLLALPWRITLEAADGEAIDLGADKVSYKVIKVDGFVATMEVMEGFAWVGESLRVFSEKKILPTTVLAVRGKEIDVSGVFASEGYLLNYSRQVTILLDAVKN